MCHISVLLNLCGHVMVSFMSVANAPPCLALGGEFGGHAILVEAAGACRVAVARLQLGFRIASFLGDLNGKFLASTRAACGVKFEVRRAPCLKLDHARLGLA